MINQWKQPTPTDIRQNESVDLLSRLIFFDILNGCQNSKYHKVYYHGNKRVDIILERGQYLFNVSKYAQELNTSRKTIQKCLSIISKWYTELHIERKSFGLIVTIKKYDEITKMNNETNNPRTTKEQRSDNEVKSTNKSDKSEESEESISKDIGDASYGDNYINILTEWFKKEYPHPLTGLSDRRRLQNLKQIMTPRKNKDKWMSSEPRENTKRFLMDYFIYQPQDKYKVRSIYKLIDIAKQWREQEGVLVNETTEDIQKDRYMVEQQRKWKVKKEAERKAYEN